MYNVQD